MAINQYSALPLSEDIFVDLSLDEIDNEFEKKIWKSAEAFEKKKTMMKIEIQKARDITESLEERKSRFTG